MNREVLTDAGTAIDWARVREDFPLLARQVNGKPLIYLDSANTGQKPVSVIRTTDDFYRQHNANVSRAVHALGSEATEAYEAARSTLARRSSREASSAWMSSSSSPASSLPTSSLMKLIDSTK